MAIPLDQQVARSLDAPVELLPHLHELLADFDELGSSIEGVMESVGGLGLSYRSRVLDLGCGKGMAGISLAEKYSCRVTGIDGFEPFVQSARRAAIEHGVAHLCEFQCADLREVVCRERDYDLVMLLAVGEVLGDMQATIAVLRACARPGGHVLLDDCYLLETETATELEGHRKLADTEKLLQQHGDRIVWSRHFTHAEMVATNARNTAFIEARAKSLSAVHPELAASPDRYVAAQREASQILEDRLGNAMWLIEIKS